MNDHQKSVEELYNVAQRLGGCSVLSSHDTEGVLNEARMRFTDGKAQGWLWEGLTDSKWMYDPQGWCEIGKYPCDSPVLLLFYDGSHAIGFEVQSPSKLPELIGEDDWFDEYYVIASDYRWCLLFSHHDVLYACGDAALWLEERARQSGREVSSYPAS